MFSPYSPPDAYPSRIGSNVKAIGWTAAKNAEKVAVTRSGRFANRPYTTAYIRPLFSFTPC